jgi:hypothetical protein
MLMKASPESPDLEVETPAQNNLMIKAKPPRIQGLRETSMNKLGHSFDPEQG